MESISGVRGIVGESLTPEVVLRYAGAFADYCSNRPVVVGRDGRITGRIITNILVSVLLAKGCDVRAIGICPTPTVALETERSDAAGGVIVTASHNPMEWNGLKFLAADGLFLDAQQNSSLRSFLNEKPAYRRWDGIGKHTVMEEAIDRHIESALHLPGIDAGLIRKKKFKVALDCVNAAGGAIVPRLLEKLGCTVAAINCDVSGIFSHTPEPLPENLTQLCDVVRSEKADLGIAVDPDVDRLVLIDEHGNPIGEEYTIASIVSFVLTHTPKDRLHRPVVVNLSTTRAVEDIAASFGTPVVRTPVGEINVAKKMRESEALIGGEGSGGIIHPAAHLGRDAIVGIVLILQYLAESEKTLSQLRSSLPQYEIVKAKIEVGNTDPDSVLRRLEGVDGDGVRINTDDGVRLDYPDYWVHFRKSNTEPIIRIIAEGKSREAAVKIVQQFKDKIAALI